MSDNSFKCFKPRYDAPLTRSGGFHGQSASIETGIFGDTTLHAYFDKKYCYIFPVLGDECNFSPMEGTWKDLNDDNLHVTTDSWKTLGNLDYKCHKRTGNNIVMK